MASARHRGKGRPSPGRPEEAARPAAAGRSWPHGLTDRGSRGLCPAPVPANSLRTPGRHQSGISASGDAL